MRLKTIILIAIIACVFIIPYGVYAIYSEGNYDVTATTTISLDSIGTFSATTPEITSESTGMWSFLDALKGTDRPDAGYTVYLEVIRSGDIISSGYGLARLNLGESVETSAIAENVSPGEADIRVYIVDVMTNAIVYDKTIEEVIP